MVRPSVAWGEERGGGVVPLNQSNPRDYHLKFPMSRLVHSARLHLAIQIACSFISISINHLPMCFPQIESSPGIHS